MIFGGFLHNLSIEKDPVNQQTQARGLEQRKPGRVVQLGKLVGLAKLLLRSKTETALKEGGVHSAFSIGFKH